MPVAMERLRNRIFFGTETRTDHGQVFCRLPCMGLNLDLLIFWLGASREIRESSLVMVTFSDTNIPYLAMLSHGYEQPMFGPRHASTP